MARKKPQRKTQNTNHFRVIGGKWRSRKLSFVNALGLRPTPDRIRETVFNWLQADIHNASCLDMFAGSGALGVEALSRGANRLLMVEQNKACTDQLNHNLTLLSVRDDAHIKTAKVLHANALDFLTSLQGDTPATFDLVFLDPPYRQGLIEKSLQYLEQHKLINALSLVYVEHEAEECIEWNNWGLLVLKQAKAGQVKSYLLQKKPIDPLSTP